MRRDRLPPSRARETIADQLRDFILTSGDSVTALAREAGVDPRVVQRFLNEERDVTIKTLDALAEPLGLRLVQTGRARSRAARPARSKTRPPLTRRDTPGNSGPAEPPPLDLEGGDS